MDESSDDPSNEKKYSSELLRAYAIAFPQIRVSVETLWGDDNDWTPEEAMASVTSLASAPVIDYCLHRGQPSSRNMCVPHIILDCMQQGPSDSLSADIKDAILNARKLTTREKARLTLLRDVRERVRWTLAYAANRCYATGYPRGAVVMFFEADGVGHANMILLERTDATLVLTAYEPNGVEAASRYDTEKRYFAQLVKKLPPLVGCDVSFRIVGLALQTYLGQRFVKKTRSSVTISRRGYPVCEAAVLWLFSSYIEENRSDVDLADFEARLMEGSRDDTKGALLSWILDVDAWVRKNYEKKMRAKLRQVFEGSDVTSVDLRYGKIDVVWSAGQ